MTNSSCNGTYADVASEYYDRRLHPTCANFREASKNLLALWLELSVDESGPILEVGSGDSLVATELRRRGSPIRNLIITDQSSQMLAHSKQWQESGAVLTLSDATKMAIRSSSAACVISILGDSYNGPRFWEEVRRVLKPGGLAIFTTPSFEWASTYRILTRSDPDAAEFELRDGRHVCLESRILPMESQKAEIETAGLVVKDALDVSASHIHGPLSPKVLPMRGSACPLVTGYIAIK